jgi:hypothetical protein
MAQPKLLLRLDDGAIIGYASHLRSDPAAQGVIRVQASEAAQLGRLTEKDEQRLQNILRRLKEQHGVEAPPVALQVCTSACT